MDSEILFADRAQAGAMLARKLVKHVADAGNGHDLVVLGLAPGGMQVAEPVARALGAPLDVLVTRKIGLPGHPEFGVGAVTADGPPIFHHDALARAGLRMVDLAKSVDTQRMEARRRARSYRDAHPVPALEGRTVIVVDDGLATSVTAAAALRQVRHHHPSRLIFAAPVCAAEARSRLADEADEVVCVATPRRFWTVGQWYLDFGQLTDDDVRAVLERTSLAYS